MYSLWVYFSYKGSPCGFQLGCIDINKQNENFNITKKQPEKLLKDFFESSLLKTAYGKLPNKEEFIYLTKKIDGTTEKSEKLYLNFAFQVNDREKFLKIYNFIEKNKKDEKLFDIFSNIVHIEDISEFGYTIDKEALKSILKEIKNIDITRKIDDILYVESTTTEEKLSDRLELEKQGLGIVKSNNTNFYEIDTIESINQKKNKDKAVLDPFNELDDNHSSIPNDEIENEREDIETNKCSKIDIPKIVTKEVNNIVKQVCDKSNDAKNIYKEKYEEKKKKMDNVTAFLGAGIATVGLVFGIKSLIDNSKKKEEKEKINLKEQKQFNKIHPEKIDPIEDDHDQCTNL